MRLRAVLALRCPRCLVGSCYASFFRMRGRCPRCALPFEREPGYFLGALYFSYALALAAGLLPFLLLWDRGLSTVVVGGVITGWIALWAPLLWRYSRVIWLHLDQVLDPR